MKLHPHNPAYWRGLHKVRAFMPEFGAGQASDIQWIFLDG